MGKTLKKILNVISTILVAIVVVLALLLVGARFIGLNVYSVLSGSMEPTYHVGSLIYVKDVDTDELKAGDVITYMLDEDTIVTHRIVDVIPDETDPSIIRFQTKGDANDSVDGSLVHYKNVIGILNPETRVSRKLHPETTWKVHCDISRSNHLTACIPA